MNPRRARLSVNHLEDRVTPASVGDLYANAWHTYATALFLEDLLSGDVAWMASPEAESAVQNFFTNVYQQASETISLLNQFPGEFGGIPIGGLASIEAGFAVGVGNALGFSVTAPAAPAAPTTPIVGPADPAHSTVSVSPTSVALGGTATVTLTAIDVNGNPLTTGGSTVTFGLGSGTAQGTFSSVTDNDDGTYTATFTSTTIGSNTITATIDGNALTSTAPTITVVGTADPSQSTISVSPTSIQVNGTSTITLTAKDADGDALTTGGSTVTFGLGTGTAQGSFGAVTDNNNGTYTATFTGTTAGTNTITATLNGNAVTSTAPTITVVGAADPTQSTITVSPVSISTNGTATVTLTAKDANGNQLTIGGSTVVFALGTGTAQGTFGTVTDNANGTYTATFTGTTAGTNTISATLDGQAVTVTAPITVAGPADPGQSTVSVSPTSIDTGDSATVTLTAKDANGDPESIGGDTVTFGLGTGAGQGTFGTVTDNGDGTYSATFTGTTAGANTITATLNGNSVTSAAPTITVIGAADPAQSVVAVAPASIETGGTAIVTLTAKDADGNQLLAGGSTVVFSLGGGTAEGTFGTVTDNGDGTYSANFTGSVVGTNTIGATIDGQTLTSTAPTITVTAVGPADPAESTVSLLPTSIATGGTSTVTLTARDASGTQLPTGGSTVVFSLGAGTAAGTFGSVTDNGDGTYSAIFTGTTAGTNTISATIDGQALTSTAPTITVTAGAADPAESTVSVAPASIATGGTSTVTLTARDASGTQLMTGGSTVVFSLGAGTALGTFGPVTDNNDGTYTATFTGTGAGTNTVTATIDGVALTSTAPTITETATADPSQSVVSLAPTSIQSGGTSTVTLTAKDASGNQLTTGGSTVLFSLGAGTASGTFSSVTDNGDGTYTATFTGTTAGTNTVTAVIDGQSLTSTAPTITVTPGTADPMQTLVSVSPGSIAIGSSATVTLTAKDANGNQLATGGSTVLFNLGTGTAQGVFSVTTDNSDGTYTSTFTGSVAGTNTISATIDGNVVTSTAPTITVT